MIENSSRPRKGQAGRAGRNRRNVPACPPIGALMRYGERTVRVVAETNGQRAIIESVNEDGLAFRSKVNWLSLAALDNQLF